MYKVAIVDDEPLVLRGLEHKVAWQEWNCIVCGTGGNGLEGKELIERERPDIVLTDVKMPGMNGLELADYVNRHFPDTVTIVISGYNEFDYAREAMRHQVFDYLLKPIDKEELRKTIRKAIDALHHKLDIRTRSKQFEEMRRETTPIIESSLLLDLMLNHGHEPKTMLERIKELRFTIHKGQVAVFDLSNAWEQYGNGRSLYQFAMNNILYEIYRNHSCGDVNVMWIEDKCVVVTRFDASIPTAIAQKRSQEATKEGAEQIRMYFKTRVYLGIGTFFERIDGIHASYKAALHGLQNDLFWAGGPSVWSGASDPPTAATVDEHVYTAIREGDDTEALRGFDRLANALRKSRNIDLVYSVSLEMLIRMNGMLREFDVTESIPTLNDLKKHACFEDLAGELRSVITSACKAFAKKHGMLNASLKDKIFLFLREHYARNPCWRTYRRNSENRYRPGY